MPQVKIFLCLKTDIRNKVVESHSFFVSTGFVCFSKTFKICLFRMVKEIVESAALVAVFWGLF